MYAALIDMDGTLYDSMQNHADAWMRICRENGLEAERDEFFLLEGRTGASTINILFNRTFGRDATPDEIERLYTLKTQYFQQLPKVSPMPGAVRLLGEMARLGVMRVLVTGSGQKSLITRLQHDFPGAFREDLMVTAANVTKGKPHPEPYLKGMEMAGVDTVHAMVFENAPLGVEAGARSGAFTVGITTGPVPAQALADAGADIIYSSMEACADDFPRLFDEISRRIYGEKQRILKPSLI